jgi:eukaryotic-like serine/threonine-protein kinase
VNSHVLGPLLLPPDVVIVPVERLPASVRNQLDHGPGDHCVTRPHSRTTSTIVDAAAAALLEGFRQPVTIVDAVIAYSLATGADPRTTLEDAVPLLGGFVDEGLLVPTGSVLATPISGTLEAGDHVGQYTVVEPVHVVVDTEIHRVRAADGTAAALKIARVGMGITLSERLAHEAKLLRRLDGRVNPRLLDTGEFGDRSYLVMTWCAGVDLHHAATAARRLALPTRLGALTHLAGRVIEAYAHLHGQGVLHGDVHPRNVLVSDEADITIIDLGIAVHGDRPPDEHGSGRGGVDFFQEPELASARLAGQALPPLTASAEQYSLAALIYLLLTGAHTHAFSLEEGPMLRQLADEPPRPFADHGVREMPAVERVVTCALAKDPGDRYASIADFLTEFRHAAALDQRAADTVVRTDPPSGERLLKSVLERLRVPGDLFDGGLAPPTASAMNGGAGFAYALLRIAGTRDDESLLATADLWSTQAWLASTTEDAFWSEELKLVPEVFGVHSFYHNMAGVQCVQALIAQARGDELALQLSLDAFVAAAEKPCEHLDVAFGRSGLLLGCALLTEALPIASESSHLQSLGRTLRDSIWDELAGQPALPGCTELRTLGAAHGWAGYLYALLRWSEASGELPPPGLEERLHELAAQGRPAGRGMWWPYEAGGPAPDSVLGSSWCNGAAGYVYLWALAHALFTEEHFAHLARQAAWSTFDAPGGAPGDLCCGYAGRAYALLCQHRHTGESGWLDRAETLTNEATARIAEWSLRPDSLYKGKVGVALLAAQIRKPEHARMPLFEGEGFLRPRA